MNNLPRLAALVLATAAATTALHAGSASVSDGKDVKNPVVTNAPASPTFTFTAQEEYDSRYMFRGVNVVPQTGILTTYFTPTWHITANDTLSVPLDFITAVGKAEVNSAYKEFDVPVNYAHAIGNWTLGLGYEMYSYFNVAGYHPGGVGIQNEINENVSYTYTNSIGTFTPSLAYYQELGTPYGYSYGSVNGGSSFLTPGIAATIPLNFIKKDGSVTFNPNTQVNFGFRYNDNTKGQPLTGLNNWQFQLPVSWQATKWMSLTGYYAYSYQGVHLAQTAASTGWAGAYVTFSF